MKVLWLAAAAALVVTGCATKPKPIDVVQADTHRQIAAVKLSKNELPMAIRHYQNALKLNPNDAEAEFGLAEAYRRRGDLDEAEKHLLRSLRLDETHADAQLNLGVVYLQQGRWEDAIAANTELIDDPTFLRPSRALVNRGWAHYKSGNLEGAENDFREALASDEGDHRSHLNLGLVLYERGELLEAMRHLEHVLTMLEGGPPQVVGPHLAQARFHLARAHVKLGQVGKAVAHLKQAADLGGQGEWGRRSREYLEVLN